MSPDLTREQYADLIRKLDEVCQQARDLARQLKAQMDRRARNDQQLLSGGTPDRRRQPRNRQDGDRRKST